MFETAQFMAILSPSRAVDQPVVNARVPGLFGDSGSGLGSILAVNMNAITSSVGCRRLFTVFRY